MPSATVALVRGSCTRSFARPHSSTSTPHSLTEPPATLAGFSLQPTMTGSIVVGGAGVGQGGANERQWAVCLE